MKKPPINQIRPKKLVEIKKRHFFSGVGSNVKFVLWSKQIQKLILCLETTENPVRLYDLEEKELTTPLNFCSDVIDFMLTYNGETLLILSESNTLYSIQVGSFKVVNKFTLKQKISAHHFVFADNTCQNIYLKTSRSQLHHVNINDNTSKITNLKGFLDTRWLKIKICSHHRVMYGTNRLRQLAFYNAKRGFKYSVITNNLVNSSFLHTSDSLRKDDKMLFSGDYNGILIVTDTRSSKLKKVVQVRDQRKISFLESKERLIFGGTQIGELIILQAFQPFCVLYFHRFSIRIYCICITRQFFAVGGNVNDPFKLFDVPVDKNIKNICQNMTNKKAIE